MAHFIKPPPGCLMGEYDVDNKLAPGSVWRMSIPVGGTGAEVALWGGKGLSVMSNNENAVANPLPERVAGDLRVFRLKGVTLNETTMIEFGRGWIKDGHWHWDSGDGKAWPGALQVRVTATAKVKISSDDFLTLEKPHMALNANYAVDYSYQMQYNPPIYRSTTARQVIEAVNAVGKLKHLVFNCHGFIEEKNNVISGSLIKMGEGFNQAELFSQFKNLDGSVVWLGACVVGNDNERNIQRAVNGRCYLVAPTFSMQLKPGQIKGRVLPFGKLDMFMRFSPKVFTPSGTTMDYPSFLAMGKRLGFSV